MICAVADKLADSAGSTFKKMLGSSDAVPSSFMGLQFVLLLIHGRMIVAALVFHSIGLLLICDYTNTVVQRDIKPLISACLSTE
jgi:hypothetical protein